MGIISAQYTCGEKITIKVVFSDNSTIFVPNNVLDNRHYAAILEWVDEGNTIQDAD
tara:strand:+ start:1994 stop:2161 length:168 start_codon:yes stop_codon:yes gene_type:complete